MSRHSSRIITAALLSGVAASALPAQAAPFAGSERVAVAAWRIGGTDGRTYKLGLTLESAENPTGVALESLTLTIASCNTDGACSNQSTYALPTSSLNVADDLGSATAVAVFGGLPVQVEWSATPASATNPTVNSSADVAVPNRIAVQEPGGGDGRFQVTLAGLRCVGPGTLKGYRVVSADYSLGGGGARPPSSLPTGLRTARGRAPRCLLSNA